MELQPPELRSFTLGDNSEKIRRRKSQPTKPPKSAGMLVDGPGYPSGQRGLTVNQLAYAFGSSNLSPGTRFAYQAGGRSAARPSSSVAEHFHGKEGVVGSIPTLGSRKETVQKKLYRNKAEGKVGGLTAGLADFLDVDVNFLRLIVLVIIIMSGIIPGIIAYLIACAFVPIKDNTNHEDTNAKT
jgi:phage shock protein C